MSERDLPENVRQAAEVIKDFCNERTGDDACRCCPFHLSCGTEPYSWEV